MKRFLTIFAIVSFSNAFAQITISSFFPATISYGSSVDADIKLFKNNLNSFAKYQLDVPVGFTISSVDSKGGNFTFENQRAKIVWVAIPSDPELTIKLKIQASSDAPNPAAFSQKFYYLENNEKKEVEVVPVKISLVEGGLANVSNTDNKIKETNSSISVSKPASSLSESGMTFKIQLGAYDAVPSKSKFAGVSNLKIDNINGKYKVTAGDFKTREEAVKYRDELQLKGYSGFIIKFKDGVRVN